MDQQRRNAIVKLAHSGTSVTPDALAHPFRKADPGATEPRLRRKQRIAGGREGVLYEAPPTERSAQDVRSIAPDRPRLALQYRDPAREARDRGRETPKGWWAADDDTIGKTNNALLNRVAAQTRWARRATDPTIPQHPVPTTNVGNELVDQLAARGRLATPPAQPSQAPPSAVATRVSTPTPGPGGPVLARPTAPAPTTPQPVAAKPAPPAAAQPTGGTPAPAQPAAAKPAARPVRPPVQGPPGMLTRAYVTQDAQHPAVQNEYGAIQLKSGQGYAALAQALRKKGVELTPQQIRERMGGQMLHARSYDLGAIARGGQNGPVDAGGFGDKLKAEVAAGQKWRSQAHARAEAKSRLAAAAQQKAAPPPAATPAPTAPVLSVPSTPAAPPPRPSLAGTAAPWMRNDVQRGTPAYTEMVSRWNQDNPTLARRGERLAGKPAVGLPTQMAGTK